MTDFRFSGGRKTNGPLIHALNSQSKINVKPGFVKGEIKTTLA